MKEEYESTNLRRRSFLGSALVFWAWAAFWLLSCDWKEPVNDDVATVEAFIYPENSPILRVVDEINSLYIETISKGDSFGPNALTKYLQQTNYRTEIYELYTTLQNRWIAEDKLLQTAIWKFFAWNNIYLNIENARRSEWLILQKFDKLIQYNVWKNRFFKEVYGVESWNKVDVALVDSWGVWNKRWTYSESVWVPIVFHDTMKEDERLPTAADEVTHKLNDDRFWIWNTIATWSKKLESNDIISIKNPWRLDKVAWKYTYTELNECMSMIWWILDSNGWKKELQFFLSTIFLFKIYPISSIDESTRRYRLWSLAVLIAIADTGVSNTIQPLIDQYKRTIDSPDYDSAYWAQVYDALIQSIQSELDTMDRDTFQDALITLWKQVLENWVYTHNIKNW